MLFTKEDLRKLLVPLVLEQFLAVLVGSMDTVMVSSCGEAAVSGVSLVDNINVLLINLMAALATGGAVVATQYLGMRRPEDATRSAKQLYYVILVFSVFLTAVSVAFRESLLRLIFGSIEADVMSSAMDYFLLTALSYPFLALYNASAALLRAEDNSKDSMVTSVIMNVVNVIGNAVFIYGCAMGAKGAALATLISRIIGAVVIQRMMKRPGNPIKPPVLHEFEWRGNMVVSILRIGVPSGLENSFFQLGKLLLLSLISTFGTASIAANAVGNTVCGYEVIVGNAVSLAMITVIGRCIGAGDIQQARYYTRVLMKKAYLYMGIVNLVIIALNPWVAVPFNLSEEASSIARTLILLHGAVAIFIWPISFCLPNVLRAAGDTVYTMAASMISIALFRILSSYFLAQALGMGVVGVWIAMEIDWAFRCVLFIVRYRGHKWEHRKVLS